MRGFGYQASAIRQGWARGVGQNGWGAEFKDKLTEPGPWAMRIGAWGECLPYADNQVTLNKQKPDQWGLPTLDVSVSFRANERAMRKDMLGSALDMLEAAGMTSVSGADGLASYPPGSCIHEMGTVRMGRDPKTSALNAHNQLHAVKTCSSRMVRA